MSVIEITSENFENEVVKSEKPVLIDFWATWCGPCQMLHPVIEELASEVKNAKICQINVDDQPQLAAKFNVMSIPTLVVMKNGKIAATSVGVQPKAAILDMINA